MKQFYRVNFARLTISAKTGSIIFATATLAVNSVTFSAKKQTISNIATTLIFCRPIKDWPSMADKPDVVLPAEMANPPPSTNIKLQCIFWLIIFHVIKPGDGFVGRLCGFLLNACRKSSFDGMMKNNIVTHMAAVESLTDLEFWKNFSYLIFFSINFLVNIPKRGPPPPMILILTYVIKVVSLSNIRQVLAIAHFLLYI